MSLTLRHHEVLTYLEAHPGATASEVASALQMHLSLTREVLSRLYTHGLATRRPQNDRPAALRRVSAWRWYSSRTVAEVWP